MGTNKLGEVYETGIATVKHFGGARRDRTADLLHAMQALSQLSYNPTPSPPTQYTKRSPRRQE